MENEPVNFETILSDITAITNSLLTDIWIPSKNKKIKFHEITASQQKDIIASSLNSNIYNTKFNNTILNIIKKNSTEDISDLTIIDKMSICLGIRSQISNIVKIQNENNSNDKIDVNLSDILNNIENKYIHPVEVEIQDKNILLSFSVPKIVMENSYETEILSNNKNINDIKTNEDIQSFLSDAFIGEISKCLNKIVLNGSEFDLNTINFKNKIKLIETLPASIIQEILKIMTEWKKDIESFLTVTTGDKISTIKIDPLFFIS